MLKRVLDVIIASALAVVLAPLSAVAAMAVRVSLGSPVLFRQFRPGHHQRPFVLYKFRTMRVEDGARAGGIDPGRARTDEEDTLRLTAVGRVLRASRIDEVPQLWNVIKGDMSLVGPRPLLTEYLSQYNAVQARRHEVRPGLTGLAQISGRDKLAWESRFALDVYYVDQRTLAMDFWILWRTAVGMLRRNTQDVDIPPFSHTQRQVIKRASSDG